MPMQEPDATSFHAGKLMTVPTIHSTGTEDERNKQSIAQKRLTISQERPA
jgi:hypothetical protein